MKVPNSFRPVICALLVALPCWSARAQTSSSCSENVKQEILGLAALLPEGGTPVYGGEMVQLEILGRITLCVRSEKCSFADQFIILEEMMIDDRIVTLQRQKLEVVRHFFSDFRLPEDSCRLQTSLPGLWTRLGSLNREQVNRLRFLADARLPAAPGAKN